MARGTLSERVERLELTVQGLEGLPGEVAGLRRDVASLGDRMTGVETQILHLRTEMRAEVSAVRGETATEFTAVRSEMQTGFAEVRAEMQTGFADLRAEMQAGFAEVRGEMRAGFSELGERIEENWNRTLALHEHLVAQIKTIGEHGNANPPGRKPRASRRKP